MLTVLLSSKVVLLFYREEEHLILLFPPQLSCVQPYLIKIFFSLFKGLFFIWITDYIAHFMQIGVFTLHTGNSSLVGPLLVFLFKDFF
jgi:hypothetical protein